MDRGIREKRPSVRDEIRGLPRIGQKRQKRPFVEPLPATPSARRAPATIVNPSASFPKSLVDIAKTP
jgi:hypothetical protein